MDYVDFKHRNGFMGKPEDWKDDECGTLPVAFCDVPIGEDGRMVPAVISCWKPTPWERDQLAAGCPVFLRVIGGMPPVSLFVDDPFEPHQIPEYVRTENFHKHHPEELFEQVCGALGKEMVEHVSYAVAAGSMSWESVDRAGRFDQDKATIAVLELCQQILKRITSEKEQAIRDYKDNKDPKE